MITAILTAGGIFLTVVMVQKIWKYLRGNDTQGIPFPPGPKQNLLTGFTSNIPLDKAWLTYTRWAKQYGSDLLHLVTISEGHVIIISSLKAALDLMEKRSRNYSDRPFSVMDDLGGWHYNVGAMPYTEEWRKNRKLFQQNFRPDAALNFQPVQRQKVREFVRQLAATPENYAYHVRNLSQGIIMATVYGIDIAPNRNDALIRVGEGASHMRGQFLIPGNFPGSSLPWARHLPSWLPGCSFKGVAEISRKLNSELQAAPLKIAMDNMCAGIPSLVGDLVSTTQARGDSEETAQEMQRIKNMAATSYLAGAGTTKSATLTFLLAMTRNPQIQKKAQEEIDRVIGTDRLPDFTDRASLPYVEAVYREVMRWHPPLPLGTSHRAFESDIYNGYYIPKGATIFTNIWAMTHDESIYDEPDQFIPERFLGSETPFTSISNILAFGFGRRVCVGRYMADATMWITIVTILATLNIAKAKDETGIEIDVGEDYTDAAISYPKPFPCSITPRSPQFELLGKDSA